MRADPENHDAWQDFAYALSDGQFHEWAEWASRKALALRTNGDNYFSVGNHLLSQKRYADARELYLQGARLSPQNPGLMHNLGFVCHLSGDEAGAVDASLRTCQIYLAANGGAEMSGAPLVLTPEEEGRSPMYIAGLGHALRRAGQLDLCVAVMASLRQPPPPGAPPGQGAAGVLSNGKIIINDNIRINRTALAAVVPQVQEWVARRDAGLGGARQGGRGGGKEGAFTPGPVAHGSTSVHLVPKAVITYLIGRRSEHYLDLIDSLIALELHFLSRFPYPVIIFHEGLGPDEMERLRLIYEQVVFHRLDRSFLFPPDHIDQSKVPSMIGGHATVGYRHMCRFFSGTMFRYPLLAAYDWFWRLDSDSFILGPLSFDPFRRMAEGGQVYGYMGLGREDEYLTTGLWSATTDYMLAHGITSPPALLRPHLESVAASPSLPLGSWDRSYYYTNFEIGNLSFFRSEAYQSYFRHLDSEGGFYYYRWGDAPIRLLGVSIHASAGSVYRFDDLPYSHKVYVVLPEDR